MPICKKELQQTPSLPNKKKAKQSPIMAKMFSCLNNHITVDLTIPDDDKESIQQTCVLEFECYLRDGKNGAFPMYDAEYEFNNPLGWCKLNCVKYPFVVHLAQKS